MRAITDARGTPTFAAHLAARLREVAVLGTADIFHIVNSGTGASYEEFARHALEIAGLENLRIMPVTGESLNRPAPRPANSCLRCLVSKSLGLAPMPDWRNALRSFVVDEVSTATPTVSVSPSPT